MGVLHSSDGWTYELVPFPLLHVRAIVFTRLKACQISAGKGVCVHGEVLPSSPEKAMVSGWTEVRPRDLLCRVLPGTQVTVGEGWRAHLDKSDSWPWIQSFSVPHHRQHGKKPHV